MKSYIVRKISIFCVILKNFIMLNEMEHANKTTIYFQIYLPLSIMIAFIVGTIFINEDIQLACKAIFNEDLLFMGSIILLGVMANIFSLLFRLSGSSKFIKKQDALFGLWFGSLLLSCILLTIFHGIKYAKLIAHNDPVQEYGLIPYLSASCILFILFFCRYCYIQLEQTEKFISIEE